MPQRILLIALLGTLQLAVLWPSPATAVDEVVTADDPLQLAPSPERALVYLLYSGHKPIDILLDRTPLGTLKGSYLAVWADPGARVIWGTERPQRFDFAPGKRYVLTFIASWSLSRTDEPAAPVQRLKLRPTLPTAKQLAEIREHVQQSDYPWTPLVLGGQLPASFESLLSKAERPDPPGTLEGSAAAAPDQPPLAERAARLAERLEAKEAAALEPAWNPAPDARLPLEPVSEALLDLASYFDASKYDLASKLRGPAIPLAGIPVGGVMIGISYAPKAIKDAAPRLLPAPSAPPEAAVLAGDPALAEIPSVLRELKTRLERSPEDVEALVLAGRLGRLAEIAQPLPSEASLLDWIRLESDRRERVAQWRGFVNKALALQPGDSAALLAQARLAAMPLLVANTEKIAFARDLDQALASARLALARSPHDPEGLAVLARFLAKAGEPDEALSLLRQESQEPPVALLLDDLAAVPVPKDAAVSQAESDRLIPLLAEKGWFDSHRELRLRSFAVPDSADKVLDFYRRQWPGSVFFDLGDRTLGTVSGHLYGQHLRWGNEGGLEPTGSKANLERRRPGIVLFLLELSNVPREAAQLMPAAKALPNPPGGRFCILSIVTMRRFPVVTNET